HPVRGAFVKTAPPGSRRTGRRGNSHARSKGRYARGYECDQPLKHQHCLMCSLDEKNGLVQAPFAAHHSDDVRRGPLSTAFATGRGSLGGAAGRGGNPASPTTNPSPPQIAPLEPSIHQ